MGPRKRLTLYWLLEVRRLITFKIEVEREEDGRWLAEVVELPGVMAYGDDQDAAVSKVQALALRVIAERLEHGEAGPELLSISFNAARVLDGYSQRFNVSAGYSSVSQVPIAPSRVQAGLRGSRGVTQDEPEP